MDKYEKLIEYIINQQDDKARELFHTIVVEKSREIYENLVVDEEGFNQVSGLVDEIDQEDEMGMAEAGDEEIDPMGGMDDMGGDDMGGDDMGGDDMGGDDMSGGGDIEDRVMDLEAALDELKAEFDALMSDEEGEPEHSDGEGDPDFGGGDDMGGEEEPKEEGFDPGMVREYVDKVAHPSNTEGQTVGAQSSSKPNMNTKSPGLQKGPNMGGSTSNIVRGGAEQSPDGKPVPQPNNQYAKGKTQVKHADQWENKPTAKTKGYTDKHTSWEKQKGAEGQTTDGKLPVDGKAFMGTTVRNK